MLHAVLGGLFIFVLRLGDVPISTVRTMLMVQGRRLPVLFLAILEAGIWIVAVGQVFSGGGLNDPYRIAGYAMGFACGTVLGMTAEKWLAFGQALVRVISRDDTEPLRRQLLIEGFAATTVVGAGRDGPVAILFVVTPR